MWPTCGPTRMSRELGHLRLGARAFRQGASRGSLPRRRTVLAVPEFDWVIDGLRPVGRTMPGRSSRRRTIPRLWVTERLTRVSARHIDERFAQSTARHSGWTRA